MDKIFISIAAYRDPELIPTIEDCLNRADHPENLVFFIAWQHHPDDKWDTLKDYESDARFKILDIHSDESLGACWARYMIQQMYDGEQYVLQLYSHHRFARSWDTRLKEMLNSLPNPKSILTTYVPSYNPKKDPAERKREVWKTNFDRFTPEGIVFILPSALELPDEYIEPIPSRFFSAHFAFAPGSFYVDVKYDPNIYFHGEEITMSVRAYTHGYDMFIPHKTVIWHEYTREGRVRHWDDHNRWEEHNKQSILRCNKLLGVDNIISDIEFGDCALGPERSIREYEMFAGIRFGTREVQNYTLQHLDAPNPKYATIEGYNNSFINLFKHCIDIYKHDITEDWDSWAIIFEDANGLELYRQDATKEEIDKIKETSPNEFYNVWRQFHTKKVPSKVIVWPYGNGEWGNRLEMNISKI